MLTTLSRGSVPLVGRLRLPKQILASLLAFLLVLFGAGPANSSSSVSFDFNTPGQLAAEFDEFDSLDNIEQSAAGGIGDTGAVNVSPVALITDPQNSAFFASKSKYSIGGQGSKYTITTFIKNSGIGFFGVGFTNLAPDAANRAPSHSRPKDAVGVSIEGSRYHFHNGTTNHQGFWNTDTAGITTIQSIPSNQSNLFSGGNWYKLVLILEQTSSTEFQMTVEVWRAAADGSLLTPGQVDASFRISNLANPALLSAASFSSFFSVQSNRISHLDNFSVELLGSTVIQAGNPVVLTTSATESDRTITLTGSVTSDGGAAVSERGMVYGTSSGPIVTGDKVVAGSGTGTFTATTPTLAAGTYFVRAFATNSAGTSYGTESTVVVPPAPAPPTQQEPEPVPVIPYSGPLVTNLSRMELVAFSEKQITIEGIRLDTVESASVDGKSISFIQRSDTELVVMLPELNEGIKDLLIVSSSGNLTHQDAFLVRGQPTAITATSEPRKLNAGSFKGLVAIYAKGYEGKRLSAKIGKDWVIVPSVGSNFVRVVDAAVPGRSISVRIFIDRVLVSTIPVLTK